ncbi:MAG TPA: hypothetical protein VLX85_15525 [Stellaceae bacterium]|nr:hypothetical protein [Stellaceae bacterium]
MTRDRAWMTFLLTAGAALILGGTGCLLGAERAPGAFFPAWLAASVFWLGLPLGALALVLVHDLTGGRWMATARPVLEAAIVTMPVAAVAFLPLFAGFHQVFAWASPAAPLDNAFYLDFGFFVRRYAVDVLLWNGLAAYALWWPRDDAVGVASSVSWASGIGLLLLAFSVSFAAIDWIMSLEPHFWSAVFVMIAGARWFNTSLALVLFIIALTAPRSTERAPHRADLAAILLATLIFWAYVSFCQYLIVWEENLAREIPWYLRRIESGWGVAAAALAVTGFVAPFLLLLSRPAKSSRLAVATAAALVFASGLVDAWWMVLPEFPGRNLAWLDAAAVLALGAVMLVVFVWSLCFGRALLARRAPTWETSHGRV